jgi:general stress protein 26
MADRDRPHTEPRDQLFDRLGDVRAGMLGVEGSGSLMQPMTAFPDRAARELWFVTSRQTELVADIGEGATAQFTFETPDQDYFATLRGTILPVSDADKLDEIWSPGVEAWFREGRRDPDVTLLRMTLRDAEIWAVTGNRLFYGLEIARATLDGDHTPDVGEKVKVDFRAAA